MTSNSDSAAARALKSLDPQTWRTLTGSLVVGDSIPVTVPQWCCVVADSGLLGAIERVRSAIERVRQASAEDRRAAGRDLRAAVVGVVEDVSTLRNIAQDVLWFGPPDDAGPKAVERHVSGLCAEAVELLDALASSGICPPKRPHQRQATLADFGATPGDDEDDDAAARVYGISVDQLPRLGSPVATRLRSAFRSRPGELHAITARIIGYALNGRVALEQLDGTVHVWALATDAHPVVAHRAARAACDLVYRRATDDSTAVATAIVEGLQNEQDSYSTHRAHSRARHALLAAEDPDEYTRAVTDVYRIICEGPLRHAATVVLRLLGERVPVTAGLRPCLIWMSGDLRG